MRVIIIGGGLLGLCSAYFCLQEGMEVFLLERNDENSEGASFGNAGLVVPSHFVPLSAPGVIGQGLKWMLHKESPFSFHPRASFDLIKWAWLFWRYSTESHTIASQDCLRDWNLESRKIFDEFAKEGNFQFQKKGLLMLCHTEKGLEKEMLLAKRALDLGLEAEICSAEKLKEMNPNFEMNVCGGILFPQDCHLNPTDFIQFLRQKIKSMGGEILYKAEVDKWISSEKKIKGLTLKNQKEKILGDAFVLSAGFWSKDLLAKLGFRLPLEAGKGYSLTLQNPPSLPQYPALLVEAKVAMTPFSDALRFGGTMEIGAMQEKMSFHKIKGIIRSSLKYFPQFTESNFASVTPWQGLRPCSADGLPYLGKISSMDNLLIATGHGMMGLSLSPISGAVIADLLSDKKPRLPIDLFSPQRFLK